jgi:serine/threonine protein kinase
LPECEPEAVLIEWKSYAGLTEYDQIVAAESHVKDLVHVLSLTRKPPLLCTMTCLGYYQDDDPERQLFGFIYKIPAHTAPTNLPLSLHALLSDAKNVKRAYALPSLSQRICIAQKLAISFLELHSAQWLHKSFHSDSVIFFSQSNGLLDLGSPYITGFEFSRPDDVAAFSFDVRKSEMDIYRHPELRESGSKGQKRPRYCKRHDIYSLGVVLLEIGLWQPLSIFEKAGMSGTDFLRRILTVARSELAHRVGDNYQEVVLKCITGDGLFDLSESTSTQASQTARTTAPGSDAKTELLRCYWAVVRELEKCHCGHKQG